jgi:alpha-glucosidase
MTRAWGSRGAARAVAAGGDRDWWRGAVIYQIYPRSFQDGNNDGVGDLPGIIHRLPHVASLGVDAIWISPFFPSPMLDFGYDVSEYCDVDPLFGSLNDFDSLVERAHGLGLKVLIDLVISHTAETHPWFRESRGSRTNAKADWYVWADAQDDGTPPNNWLSVFGGSAWEWDGERMQYYMHNFLPEQPDLNFHTPAVQDAVLDVARFWLDRGVDGFRLDTVNFYFHDARLRDNPALDPDLRNDTTAPAVNPYNFQHHLFDKTQPENLAFLERFRALLDSYPAATAVGEVGDSHRGAEIQAEYTKGDGRLHMCYGFDFLAGTFPTGTRIGAIINDFEHWGQDSWSCWAFSNHDVARHPSRWNLSEAELRLYAAILCSLRGSISIYQGEELGLTEAYVAFEDLRDPYGIRFWPKFKGRDGCRTPIPWTVEAHHGGFSESNPWLPMAMEHLDRAVSVQERDPGSTLNFYRALIDFRRAHPALVKGSMTLIQADDRTLSFVREWDGRRMFCAFNLSDEEQTIALPKGNWRQDRYAPFAATMTETAAVLPAFQGVFALELD